MLQAVLLMIVCLHLGILSKPFDDGFKRNRLHSVAVLKHFGFGDRRVMETRIHAELEHLMKYVRAKDSAAFYPVDIIALSTLNVIYDLMLGSRFEAGDPMEIYIRQYVRNSIDELNPLYDLFPVVVHLPPFRGRLGALRLANV